MPQDETLRSQKYWFIGVLVAALGFFNTQGWLQYFTFSIPAVDFSIFDEALMNTERGRFMVTSVLGGIDHFGVHSMPILFLLLPFHWLVSSPLFLISTHACALASAVVPLWILARACDIEPKHRLWIALAFFSSPFLIKILDYQFHPEVFYVPLFLWFAVFLEQRSIPGLLISGLLILSVKEDGAVYLGAALFAAAVVGKLGKIPALIGLAICGFVFYMNMKVVIPAHAHQQTYQLANSTALYGDTVDEAITGAVNSWKEVGLEYVKGKWLRELFRFCFFPLSQFDFIISVFPFAVVHSAFARSGVMKGLSAYYSAPYLPWIFIAWIYSLMPIRNGTIRSVLILFALGTSVPAWYPRHLPSIDEARRLSRGFDEIAALIGPNDEVCAQGTIYPHLIHHENLHLLTKECVSRGVKNYILNAKLDHYPFTEFQFEQLQKDLDSNRAYTKTERVGFVLYRRN